ncbi:MAG: hypothetical protein ABIO70_03100 [Pseudomonadota bacterium]
MIAALATGCVDYFVHGDDPVEGDRIIIEEHFTQAPAPAVDVLWVIDDTASMAREQAALAEAFRAFAESLTSEGISYQLGVVTTDLSGEDAGALQGVPWIITPEQEDPAAAFSQAVQVGTDGAGPEAGLAAALVALDDEHLAGPNRGFRRPEALLHVVAVSDSDDHSDEVMEDDPATALLAELDAQSEVSGLPSLFSAVAGDLPDGCAGITGRAPAAEVYAGVVEATGGVFASICTPDMDPVVRGLGVASLIYPDTFTLQARPDPDTLAVWVDARRLMDGWDLRSEPPAVEFDEPPPADASVWVRYSVLEE